MSGIVLPYFRKSVCMGCRNSIILQFRNRGILELRSSGIPAFWGVEVPDSDKSYIYCVTNEMYISEFPTSGRLHLWDSRIPSFWNAWILEFMSSRILRCWDPRFPETWYCAIRVASIEDRSTSGHLRFWCSSTPEFENVTIPKFWNAVGAIMRNSWGGDSGLPYFRAPTPLGF